MPPSDDFHHYLPVNDAAMQWGVYLTGIGRANIPAGQEYPPVGHPSLYDFKWLRGRVLPEFQVILLTDGRGTFESERTGEMPIAADNLVFLFPGVWHRYRPDQATGWTERWLSLNGELIHRLADLNVLRPEVAVRPAKGPKRLVATFDRLLEAIHADPNQNSILLSLEALAYLGTALESVAARDAPPNAQRAVRARQVADGLVAQALDLIWTHSHRSFDVGQLAKRMAVSRRALERHFCDALGHTVLEEINACRLSRAKRLLRETDLGVKTVAALAGFSSEERMRVTFVQTEGMSPSKYRKEASGRG